MAYKDLINMQTNWGSFLPGGKPFRYNAANPTAANIYGQEYDTSTWQPIVDQTQDDRVVPTMGSHVLHPRATKRYNEYNAAMRDLIEKNPDQLGTINPSGKVNKMSAFPDISHINWSGILQGGKNIFGLGRNQAVDVQYPEKLQNNPFSDMRYADRQDAGRQGVHPPLLPSNYGAGMRGPFIHPMIDQPVPNNDWRYDNTYIHNKYGLPEYQGELTGRPHRGDVSGLANLQELGTEHSIIAPDKKRSFSLPTFGLSGILQGLKNQFEYKGAENTAFDPNTGQYLTAEEQDKLNARGGWYSDAARYDRRQRKRVANMLHRRDVLKKAINDKRLEEMIKKGYGEDKTITPPSSGPGTKAVYEEHGWTQPTYHEDSFTSPRDSESAFGGDFSGAGRSRHARGGRVRYSTGGRVGILAAF